MTPRIRCILLGLTIGVSAFALPGCSSKQLLFSSDAYMPIAAEGSLRSTVGQGQGAITSPGGQNATPARIAITHGFTLRAPSGDIEALQHRHLDECAKLGCTIITSRLDRSNAGRVSANSSVRISPGGFAEFAASLARPPADLVFHSQTAEDKTIPLTDLEKRVEVKIALRDRLTAMLKDPNTKTTADLLAIEKELTQVQGEIEAAIAQRDYLRTITDTVRVDISYTGVAPLTAGVDFNPLHQALSASGRTITASAAELVTFLAASLPWLPLVALLAWGIRRFFRRRRVAAA